jgi:biopolymer transport protein ExbB
MWAILGLSIISLAFVLERLFRLRRGRICPAGMAAQAEKHFHAGEFDQIRALCDRRPHATLTKILEFGLRHPKASMVEVNSVASDIASRDRDREMMLIYPLGVVAALAPLLGLFGTVVGMIESFEIVAIAGSMGDPSMLSASISKALVTTAFGLLVAMPALFAYQILRLWTNAHFRRLEEEANGLIIEWFMRERRVQPTRVAAED